MNGEGVIMKKHHKIFPGLLSLLLAMVFLVSSPQSIFAAGDTSRYVKQFLSSQYPGMNIIAEAYLVGPDRYPNNKATVGILPVSSSLKTIQGQTIRAEHKRQDNMENLEDIYSSIIGQKPNYDYSLAYVELEKSKLQVVAVDDKYVTFWSNGYRGFSDIGPASCNADDWLQSHSPGFYRVPLKAVWLNYPTKKYNHIPAGKEDTYETTGTVLGNGVRVTEQKAVLYTQPAAKDRNYAYMVSNNATLKVVSTEEIPAIDGTNDTYYKVIYKGNTAVNYMSNYCYLYINSNNVDVMIKNKKMPKDLQRAYTKDLAGGQTAKLYSEKIAQGTTTVVAKIPNQTNLWWSPSNDIKGYRAIWYSGRLCYIQNKYFVKGEFVQKLHATNLRVKDVVDGQYLLTWDKTTTLTDYTVEIVNEVDGMDQRLFYRDKEVTENEFLIDKKYFNHDGTKRSYICVRVFANDYSSRKNSTTIKLKRLTTLEETKKPSWDEVHYTDKMFETFIDFNVAGEIQMSTDKSFKQNVQTSTSNSNSKTFENLKPGTTYYFRFRHVIRVQTDKQGLLSVGGPWSDIKAISTKEKEVYKEIKEIFYKDVKDNKFIIGWNAVEGATAYSVTVQSTSTSSTVKQPVKYKNSNYTKTEITVQPEWFKDGRVKIFVSAKVNGKWTAEKIMYPDITFYPSGKPDATYQQYHTDAKGIYLTHYFAETLQIQVSTDATFNNSDPVFEKSGNYVAATELKSNTTYYFRYRMGIIRNTKKDLEETTQKVTKSIWGDWSSPIKVKTTK